jgi:hypothetical protein
MIVAGGRGMNCFTRAQLLAQLLERDIVFTVEFGRYIMMIDYQSRLPIRV